MPSNKTISKRPSSVNYSIKKQINETAKSTNKKISNVITSSNSFNNKMKKINKIMEVTEFKLINKSKKLSTLNKSTILGILKSGYLTLDEARAVKILLIKNRIYTLNENTAKILDGTVSIILESNYNDVLTEGVFGDILQSMKDLGDKAKEALKSGWSKVKGIWAEFTDLAKEVVAAFVEGLKSGYAKMGEYIKSGLSKIQGATKEKLEAADKSKLKQEVKDVSATFEFWNGYIKSDIVENKDIEAKVVKGDFNVEDDTKLDDKSLEVGLTGLEKIADSHIRRGALLSNYKTKLLSNVNVLNALAESRVSRMILSEGGGFKHLEGSIKNPLLKNIVTYAIQGIGWVLNPVGKILTKLIQEFGKKGLPALSDMTKKLGGPGVFTFPILVGLLAEAIETTLEVLHASKFVQELIALIPVIGQLFTAALHVVEPAAYAMIAYGIATLIYNLVIPFK